MLFLAMLSWKESDEWRDSDDQCVYALTPSDIDKNVLQRILEEGVETAFSPDLVSSSDRNTREHSTDSQLWLYAGLTLMLARRGKQHLSESVKPVNRRMRATRGRYRRFVRSTLTIAASFPNLSRWTLAPVFAFADPIPMLPLHFLEHFVLAAFGCTDLTSRGINVNLFDSFTRECLVTSKMVLKILVAVERLLEKYPNSGYCWPIADDKAAWDAFLEPAYPDGIPCTPVRMSIILSGVERSHLHSLVVIPKVTALCERRRTGSFSRGDDDTMMMIPTSLQHLRLHKTPATPSFSDSNPANILQDLCKAFHPLLIEELAEKTTSRDRPRDRTSPPTLE